MIWIIIDDDFIIPAIQNLDTLARPQGTNLQTSLADMISRERAKHRSSVLRLFFTLNRIPFGRDNVLLCRRTVVPSVGTVALMNYRSTPRDIDLRCLLNSTCIILMLKYYSILTGIGCDCIVNKYEIRNPYQRAGIK